jgi:pyridoxine kinase
VRLTDLTSLQQALTILHTEYHVPNVVISSIPLRRWLRAALPTNIQPPTGEDVSDADYLMAIVSSTSSSSSDRSLSTVYARHVSCLPGYFSGVGDLFSALVLAHYQPTTGTGDSSVSPISYAVSQALTKTHSILTMTHKHATSLPEEDRLPTDEELDKQEPDRVVRRMKGRELRLIQGQDVLRSSVPVKEQMVVWDTFWTSTQQNV